VTPTQWERVRDLFAQAVERDAQVHEAWLHDEAAGDPAVVAEVRSLLEHHARAGAFLSEPVADRVSHLFEEDDRIAPGTVVGPYRIERELGRGGMGRVYLATDSRLARTVALKALPPDRTRDDAQRERLRREARSAAALTHPGICTIYALEEYDGALFIATEYIDGRTLRAEIEDGTPPTADALMVTAGELAAALAAAHRQGIAHRDLKPENVMRTSDGHLKILDFGLAIMTAADVGHTSPRMTQPGAVIGTPTYMAPEQLNGGTVDARTDVFALGVLLYEYATGRHPFEAPTPVARAANVLAATAPSLAGIRPDLSSTLTAIIGRCLRKNPSDRFASAGEIVDALGADDRLAPFTSGEITSWWRRHQVVLIGVYLAACAVAWQIKEWAGGVSRELFLAVGVAAAVAGVFRGHLLFAERMRHASFSMERRRTKPVTLTTDLVMAIALASDGLIIQEDRPVAALLTIALALGIAIARLVVERSTAAAAFGGHVTKR
jgi:predicted Ser/Thr protein kinase